MAAPSRSRKPSLAKDSLAGSSYLDDHLEYKSRQTGPSTSSDGLLEQPARVPRSAMSNLSLSSASRRSISAIPPSPIVAQESGTVHTISHTNCIPEPGDPARLVATIFYNSSAPRHPH